MRVRGWYASDIGLVRRCQEDNYHFAPELGLFIVADGMGGHKSGDVASRIAVTAARDAWLPGPLTAQKVRTAVDAAANAVENAAKAAKRAEVDGQDMGTTIVLLAIQSERGVMAHAGDSRCYRLRAGRLRLMTLDHSSVQEAINNGLPEQAVSEILRTQGGMITNSLGFYRGCTILEVVVNIGDAYLLCSDGLNGMISDDVICAIMNEWKVANWQSQGDYPDVADALVAAANAAGGKDNITVAVVDIS